MVIAIDPKEEFDYVLKADRELPEEQQTVFKLRPLSHTQRTKLQDMEYRWERGTDVISMPQGSMSHQILQCGLAGWTNLRDAEGNEIEFRTGKVVNVLGKNVSPVADACLDRLHPADLQELAQAIGEVQRVTVEEGKG